MHTLIEEGASSISLARMRHPTPRTSRGLAQANAQGYCTKLNNLIVTRVTDTQKTRRKSKTCKTAVSASMVEIPEHSASAHSVTASRDSHCSILEIPGKSQFETLSIARAHSDASRADDIKVTPTAKARASLCKLGPREVPAFARLRSPSR